MQHMPRVTAAVILNGDTTALETTLGRLRSLWPWINILNEDGHAVHPNVYVMLLEAGDFVLPYKLKTQIDFLEENPDVDIAVSDAYISNVWGHVFEYWRFTAGDGSECSWSQVPLSTVVIRTKTRSPSLPVQNLLEIPWPTTKEKVIRCLQQTHSSAMKPKAFPLATVKVTELSAWEWLIAKSHENEQKVRAHFLEAETLVGKGDHGRALLHYERVTESAPAIVQNRKFWSLHPTVTRSYLMRALCHHVLGQHRKAISLATFYISMDGPSREAFQMIAQSMDHIGWTKASHSLRETELFRNAPSKEPLVSPVLAVSASRNPPL